MKENLPDTMRTMPRPSVRTVRTADQLLHLHDPPWRHELVRGHLQTMSPAGSWHGDITSRLHRLLANPVHDHRVGKVYAAETGFLLARGPDTVLAPDIAFVQQCRVPASRSRGFFVGAPDLAVEVRSPADTRRALRQKARCWLDHGVRLVWLVDPERASVTAWPCGGSASDLTAQDVLTGGDVLPGFAVPVRAIFAD